MEDAANSGLFVAHALGRFAGADLGDEPGWPPASAGTGSTVSTDAAAGARWGRTTVADVADHLWRCRDAFGGGGGAAAGAPRGPRRPTCRAVGDDVVAVDWGTLGHGPVGADLYYRAVGARGVRAAARRLPAGATGGLATPDEAALGARVTAVYTVLNRAEWALTRVAGEGRPRRKYRHPAVAPHLRALQRQFPQIEALLEA